MAQKGQVNSYVGTVPHKRTVSDRITLTDPMEIPLISALGLDNESKFRFVNAPGKMYEWLNDTYVGVSTTGNDTDLTNDSTVTTVTVTDGSIFQVGDVLQLDNEYIWVSAVSTNDLTVVRNFGGTQATHASDVSISKRYNARLEGAAAGDSPFTEATSLYNYSVIMQKTIQVSRTDARINQYGIPDVVDREIDKAMDENKMNLTRLPYYGVRAVGSATAARSAGGLETFILAANKTALTSTPALTQKNIEDSVGLAWAQGGQPNLMVCNSWPKRKLADFYGANVRTERSERLGGLVIDRVLTGLGITLDVLVDRFCPTNKIFFLDTRYVGFITIDEFFYEELGKTKDTAAYGQVVGEYGFVVDYPGAHAMISGFSTSA